MDRVRVAVDAMGGDHAPAAPVRGALDALAGRADLRVALVGQRERIVPLMAGQPAEVLVRAEVVPATEVIGPDEAPAAAFRRKRDSSIAVGLALCRAGDAGAFVSSGNTGALIAGSVLTFGPIPGVDRPAMPVILPTVDGRGCVLLDVGAHVDAGPRNLFDYAVMGSLFARSVRGVDQPRVGLLNVGTEPRKGNSVSQKAYELLAAGGLNFVGNVEGRDLFGGGVDVVVTDGFVGNIVIKTIEGVGQGVNRVLGYELRRSGFWTLLGAAMAARTLRRLRRRLDYAEYGAVPLLGVNGVCLKSHGSSDARAMRAAVRAAADTAASGVVGAIASALPAPAPSAPAAAEGGQGGG